jgi:LacI family transcriptional regulator, xylobiose transport system transcriptional regulator
MAEQAVHLVSRLRDEPELAFSRIDLDTTLVVRESTARPRVSGRQSIAKVSNS